MGPIPSLMITLDCVFSFHAAFYGWARVCLTPLWPKCGGGVILGEFVGIDPGKAYQLIRQMETAKGILAGVRPRMEDSIAAAGADWAGTAGTAATHRAWAFFNDSQRDLKWRIGTITQLHPTTMGGMLTAKLPFATEAQATAAGRMTGAAIAEAFTAHMADGSPESWTKVETALAEAKAGTADAAYAAGLLAAIGGPAGFRNLFSQWMSVNATGPHRGLSPKALAKAKDSLGPLAAAFAGADKAGWLDGRWRRELLEQANPATLSAMLVLARQSDDFLNQAAMRLLQSPWAGFQPTSPDADWNTHWLVEAYDANPEALQKLLASEPKAAGLLLRPELVKGTSTPEFEKLLADVLGKTLNKDAGDPVTREMAWFNLVNGLGYEGSEKVSGHFATLQHSPINVVLATNLAPYLEQFTLGQARATSPSLGMNPAFPWNRQDPNVAARFFGALMQDPAAVKILQKQFQQYAQGLDIGKAHPFSSDPEVRAEYTRLSAKAGGLANLLLGGSTYAEFNDDEFIDLVSDAVLLPADYAINSLRVGPAVATAIGFEANGPKDGVADLLKDYLDKNTPDTATAVADAIVTTEVASVIRSLQLHNQKPLTDEDKDQLLQAFRGRLYPALVKALENRGG